MTRYIVTFILLICFILFIYIHELFNNKLYIKSMKIPQFFKKYNNKIENKSGCCYDIGFSSLMIPIYNNYRSSNNKLCNEEERIGGATRYHSLNCSELRKYQLNNIRKNSFI